MIKITAVVGSLRKGSYNRSLINAFAEQAPEGAVVSIAEIGQIPFYNEDVENAGIPAEAAEFKSDILSADAILIATPEYNRTLSGVLKNALEWSSRPVSEPNPFGGKKVLVVGASPGSIATALAQYDLKKILLRFKARVLGDEFMVGQANEKFNTEGNLVDEDTKKYIDKAWEVLLSDF